MDDCDLIQLVNDDELAQQTSSLSAAAADDDDDVTLLEASTPAVISPSPSAAADGGPREPAVGAAASSRLEGEDEQRENDAEEESSESTGGVRQASTSTATRSRTTPLPSLAELREIEPPTVHPHDSLRGPPGGLRTCLMRAALSLGVIQILLGLIDIPIAVVAIVYCSTFGFVGHGIWAPVMCIVAGISSILAWSKKSLLRTSCHVTLTTTACVCSAVMTGLSVYSSVVDSEPHRPGGGSRCSTRNSDVTFLLDMLLAVLAMIQLVISILNSAVACRAACTLSGRPPVYCVSNDMVLFDGVRCWARTDLENPSSATGEEPAPPPAYTLPPYTPPEMPPPYK